jgi:phage terminase large subunit
MAEIVIFPQYKPFFIAPKRFNVIYGGRGKGSTWNIARGLLALSCEKPLRILCTREYQNSINESVYHTLTSQIVMLGLEPNFEIQKTSIRSKAGSEFIFKGLRHNIDSIKSMEGINIVWVAEADKVPQDSWDKLIPTIRTEDSRFYIDFNTDSIDDPVYRMFVAQERDDTQVMFQNYRDNPKFPQVLTDQMLWDKEHDYDKYMWIWEGQPRSISDACIFHGKFRSDWFETPDDAQFFHGLDFGFAHDPLAAIRCFIKDDTLFIDREVGGVGIEITDTPRVLEAIPTFATWDSVADSARPELISYLRKNGYPRMKASKKGKGSIEDGIAKIRGFKEVIIHERCKNTLEEFKLYSYKKNSTTGDITPVPEDLHNHYIDSLRYALEPLNRGMKAGTINNDLARIIWGNL